MAKSFLLPRDPMSDDIPNSYGAGQQYGTNAAQNGQNSTPAAWPALSRRRLKRPSAGRKSTWEDV